MLPWRRAQLATQVVCSTFKAAGVERIDENGGGAPGVRLRKPPKHSDKNRGAPFLRNEPNLLCREQRAVDTLQLNFGDCVAYALAKATGEPLLFKGDDFIHTDSVQP
jgi:hypothetical protein